MKLYYRNFEALKNEGLVRFERMPIATNILALSFYSPDGQWYMSVPYRKGDEERFGKEVWVVRDTANPFSLGFWKILNPKKLPVVDDWDIEHHPYMFERK